jgi:hypothetical protein
MNTMNMPGFTAEASLHYALGHYYTQLSVGSTNRGSVQPQQSGCWCSEPDIVQICRHTHSGVVCYDKKVCLQWVCPRMGSEVEPEDWFKGYER